MKGDDGYGHRWASTPDNDRVECVWCLATPGGKGADEPCDRAVGSWHDKPLADLDAMITEAVHRDTVSEKRVREIVALELRIYDNELRRYLRRYVVSESPDPLPETAPAGPLVDESKRGLTRWFERWEDGASREYQGMRDDAEQFARQQEDGL